MTNLRIGHGFDVHSFSDNRELFLGGVKIDYKYGLQGHSDADVLLHSIIDSLLGASDSGDIGQMFPDTDSEYRNIGSIILLHEVYKLLNKKSVTIVNIDSTVICEQPKIFPYIQEIKKKISDALSGLNENRIGIKGKTTEKLGYTGRGEGIAVHTVSLVQLNDK